MIWFKGLNYVTEKIKPGVDYIVFGKPTEFGHIYTIAHPDMDSVDQADKVANGLTPFYSTTEKMKKSFLNSRAIQNLQYTLLNSLNWTLPETLPEYLLARIQMMPFAEAIRNVHFPESVEKLRKAQLRLKFDELFFIQLNMLRSATLRKRKLRGIVFASVGDCFNTFYKDYLPFELTNAQKRVVREIRTDMGSGRQMNRLLQGDVGERENACRFVGDVAGNRQPLSGLYHGADGNIGGSALCDHQRFLEGYACPSGVADRLDEEERTESDFTGNRER